MRYFTVVAEHRHFGRAAADLRIAQPSLSRQIRRLEAQLGARLLDRTPQGTRLTVAGEVFLPRARALLRSAAQAAAATRAAAQPSRITIGYTPGLIVTPAVRNLRHQHPDADVQTLHLEWDEPREALRDHRVDAAVTRLPIRTDGLHVTILYDEPRMLLVPLDHRLAGKESVTLDDIADEPIPRFPDPAWNAYWRIDPRPDGSPAPDGPSSKPSRTNRAHRRRPGRGHHPRRPPGWQPPPRPHHDPPARRRAEPCRPGHPRRRPQPPGDRLPQVRPRLPHRPRLTPAMN